MSTEFKMLHNETNINEIHITPVIPSSITSPSMPVIPVIKSATAVEAA